MVHSYIVISMNTNLRLHNFLECGKNINSTLERGFHMDYNEIEDTASTLCFI